MSSIGNFLYTVFLISLAAGVAEIFAPKGETKKYVKYIVSLVILIALAIPAVRLFKDVPQLLRGLSAACRGRNIRAFWMLSNTGGGSICRNDYSRSG